MLKKAQMFYLKQGCKIQKLTKKLHYAVEDLEFRDHTFEGGTGLKVMMGGVKNGKALICLDIDCKNNLEKLLGIIDTLKDSFGFIKNTFVENTKSYGLHIFFKVNEELIKKTSKIIFEGFLHNEDVNIEVFMNAPITVAPTKTSKGNYVVIGRKKPLILEDETFHELMRYLRDNSINTVIQNGGQGKKVEIDDKEIMRAVEILEYNGIKCRRKGKNVVVWDKGDTSSNGDWIINRHLKMWNFKTYERIGVIEWIKKQNGEYKSPPIKF
jgi:hypothetical protein